MLFIFQTGARVSDALDLEDNSPDIDLVNRKVIFRDMKNGEDGEADLTIEMVYEIQTLREWKQRRAEEWLEARRLWGKHRKRQDDTGRGGKKPNGRLFGFIGRASICRDIWRMVTTQPNWFRDLTPVENRRRVKWLIWRRKRV